MLEDIIRRMVLRNNHHVEKDDILSLRGTKAVRLEALENTNAIYNTRESWSDVTEEARKFGIRNIPVTTWSSLLRSAIDELKPQLDYILDIVGSLEFKDTFEVCLNNIINETEIVINSNCPRRLFKEAEEDNLITSSVYKNNKNHMIKIMEDEDGIAWYLCAVYTGEIIVMLEALLDTINSLADEYHIPNSIVAYRQYTLVLCYVNREDIADDVPDEAEEPNEGERTIPVEALERDLIGFSMQLRELILSTYKMSKKYNLERAEDIIRGIYSEDMPKDIKSIASGNDVY